MLHAKTPSLDVDAARTVTVVHFVGVAPVLSTMNACVFVDTVPVYIALPPPISFIVYGEYVVHIARLLPCVTAVPDTV